jgi:hypothetical protein
LKFGQQSEYLKLVLYVFSRVECLKASLNSGGFSAAAAVHEAKLHMSSILPTVKLYLEKAPTS